MRSVYAELGQGQPKLISCLKCVAYRMMELGSMQVHLHTMQESCCMLQT